MCVKVLIVDDERLFREGLSAMIDDVDLGFTICGVAANGKEALKVFEEEKPDLVITDIRMPVMNGLILANMLRSLSDQTLIVFLTGYKDFEYAQLAIQYRVFDYLLKPSSLKQLTNLLNKAKQAILLQRSELSVQTMRQQLTERLDPIQAVDDLYSETNYSMQAIEFVEQHYAMQCTLSSAAEELFLSPGYLGKRFRADMGIPFSQYVTQFRMEKAMDLLTNTNIKIYQVATQVGIDDPNYFATLFKRYFGIAPSDLRKTI